MKNGVNSKKLIVIMLIALMTAMTGCTTWDNFEHTFINKGTNNSENTILIGVFEPQTGRYSEAGLSEMKGIELAHSIYNSVNGYQIRLVNVDTQSSTTAGETAIQGLVKMKPVAIIGSAGEATSLIASTYIDKAKIPTITPSATNPLITQNHRYYFRASLTGSQEGEGVADYAYNTLGSRHIGIVTAENDTTATALLDGFNDKIKKATKSADDEDAEADSQTAAGSDKDTNNDPVVMNEAVTTDDNDFSKVIAKMKKNNVDTVLATLGAESMDAFFSAVESAGLTKVKFIGTRAWGSGDFVKMMENHKKIKVAFPYHSISGSNEELTKEAEKFRIQYAIKYGDEDIPNDSAALGYDSYLLMVNAIHNAGSLKGKDIRAALLKLDNVKCATGTFSFDEKGNTVRAVNISTIKDGKVVSLKMTDQTTEKTEIEGATK